MSSTDEKVQVIDEHRRRQLSNLAGDVVEVTAKRIDRGQLSHVPNHDEWCYVRMKIDQLMARLKKRR